MCVNARVCVCVRALEELQTVAGGLFLVGLLVLAVAALGYVATGCRARLLLLLVGTLSL